MKASILSIALTSALSFSAIADEMNNSQHMAQMKKAASSSSATPTEAGQSSFVAIAEIVKILSEDPGTDWSTVNITALREHLLDMNNLVMGASVKEQTIESGMRFDVTGKGDVLQAIQRMVPAHSKELNKMDEYTVITESIDGGVSMIVTASDDKITFKIKGLGFFGLMATGSHHQPHHFMMATGKGHMMQH